MALDLSAAERMGPLWGEWMTLDLSAAERMGPLSGTIPMTQLGVGSHLREPPVTHLKRRADGRVLTLAGMRMLTGLCTALLLLAPAARPAYADEIVVDDSAPSVQVQGTWAVSSASSGFFGAGYRYRVAGDGSSSVTWPFPATAAAGSYEVFARWTSGSNRASDATYVVTNAAGSVSVSVDQRTKGSEWQSLGTFGFKPSADERVTLSDKANGIVIADAVRWVPASTATPPVAPASTAADARFFDATGYRIE